MVPPEVQSKYLIGSTPSTTFIPYLVFISFLACLTGTFTTVELLQRRVTGAGWRSWVDLTICSVNFGSAAIWCTHFIGNRAIVLGDGERDIQLYYDATYFVLSATLPIFPILTGFLTTAKCHEIRRGAFIQFGSLAVCGLCTGGAATMLHYIANNGITNYIILFSLGNILGASVIAIVTCSVGFGLFFYWSQRWMNNIWRRMLVSLILALGICGTYWTATVGTQYQIVGYHDGEDVDKNMSLIVACSMLATSCIASIILFCIDQHQRQQEETRTQQIVLAVALFDRSGKLLVDNAGLMPCQNITESFHQGALEDDFNTSHPVFQWIFRVTRNWTGISDLIPVMRHHLQSMAPRRNSHHPSNESACSITFRELFCITAEDIAKSLDIRLEELGCLYEDILTTGTTTNKHTTWKSTHARTDTREIQAAIHDLELGKAKSGVVGNGQLLLLTRNVDDVETHRLQQSSFRFANIEQVSDSLARSLDISCSDVEYLMARLHAFNKRQHHVPKRGTYLASFLVQPKPGMRDMDVVVPRANSGQLPMIKLDDSRLSRWQIEILSTFHGLTLEECLEEIKRSSKKETKDIGFIQEFSVGIESLLRECPEETLYSAVFSAQQLDMVHGQTNFNGGAKIFAFCGIKQIHEQSLQSFTLKTIPFSFFKTYLRSQPGCTDHAMLVKRNHNEFSFLQQTQSDVERPYSIFSIWPSNLRRPEPSRSVRSWNAERGSMNESINSRLTAKYATAASAHLWGDVVMSSIMDINSAKCKSDGKVELQSTRGKRKTIVVDTECPTLADQLMLVTTSYRGAFSSRPPY